MCGDLEGGQCPNAHYAVLLSLYNIHIIYLCGFVLLDGLRLFSAFMIYVLLLGEIPECLDHEVRLRNLKLF